MKKRLSGLLSIFWILFFAGSAAYEIKTLSPKDKTFHKFKTDVKKNYAFWQKLKKKFKITGVQDLKRLSIAIYRVKQNDSVFSVAEKMGMVADTLISFNSLVNSESLSPGDELLIPNMDGVVLFPKRRTAIRDIARIYRMPVSMLMYINNIHRDYVYPREEIFIPFARMSDEEKNYFLAKPFMYPLKGGRFTSNYGMRVHPITGRRKFHGGFDIAVPTGSTVYASASGKVMFTGWKGGYGKLVVLRHKYGYTSLYGHLSRFLVRKGQYVKQGQRIARSGNTGMSTGPHLHFEIRRFNHRKNPLEVLDFRHNRK